MAKGFQATTNIRHGMPDGEVKEFGVGQPVTGLSNQDMKELWDNGALEEYETKEEVVSEEAMTPVEVEEPETPATEGGEPAAEPATEG